MPSTQDKGTRVKTIAAVVAVAGVLLMVLAYRVVKLRSSYDAQVRDAQERMAQEAEREARELLLLEEQNTDCVAHSPWGTFPFDFPLEFESCPPRSAEEISQAEAAKKSLAADLERARAGNTALQERLRRMEEHDGAP